MIIDQLARAATLERHWRSPLRVVQLAAMGAERSRIGLTAAVVGGGPIVRLSAGARQSFGPFPQPIAGRPAGRLALAAD